MGPTQKISEQVTKPSLHRFGSAIDPEEDDAVPCARSNLLDAHRPT